MPSTTNKGYETQTTGSNSGTWGDVLNDSMISFVDLNMAGVNSQSLSSSNVTLTTAESRRLVIRCTGVLLANITITTPGLGFYIVDNQTTGAFTITLQYTGAVGGTPTIPQGGVTLVVIDSTNGVRVVLPGDLLAIEALTATTGILKKTAANTWSLSTGVADLANTTADRLYGTSAAGVSGLITTGAALLQSSGSINVVAATQANMEAQDSTNPTYPNVQKFHPGHPKAGGNLNGSGTPAFASGDYGMGAVTDNGTGNYTLNLDTAFGDTNYWMTGFARWTSTSSPAGILTALSNSGKTTSAMTVVSANSAAAVAIDSTEIGVSFWGDYA